MRTYLRHRSGAILLRAQMPNISDRLIALREQHSRRSFADKLGVKESTLRNYEKGATMPPADFLEVICKILRVEARWLLLGEGVMKTARKATIPKRQNKLENDTDLEMIPIVKAILSAGGGSFEVDGHVDRYMAFQRDFLRRKGCIKTMVLMTVSGDSMEPDILDKDVVLIDQNQTRFMPNGIYAVALQGMIYLKKINALPGKIILESINARYQPISVEPCDMDSVRILGRAIWWCREAL